MISWWQQILPIWNAKHRQNPLLFAQRVNSNDIVLIVQKNQKKYKKVLAKMRTLCYTVFRKRECWNWQTGKTKDLVGVCSCGFKSHLPHTEKRAESLDFIQVFCSFYCLNDTIFVSRCLTFLGGGITISCGGCRADKTSWSFCSVLIRVKM